MESINKLKSKKKALQKILQFCDTEIEKEKYNKEILELENLIIQEKSKIEKSKTISLRLTKQEFENLEVIAKKEKLRLSDFVRQKIFQENLQCLEDTNEKESFNIAWDSIMIKMFFNPLKDELDKEINREILEVGIGYDPDVVNEIILYTQMFLEEQNFVNKPKKYYQDKLKKLKKISKILEG